MLLSGLRSGARWAPGCVRRISTLRSFPAGDKAAREVPTPLLFVAAPTWTGEKMAEEQFAPLLRLAQQRGFTSLLLDLDVKDASEKSASEVLALMENGTSHS
ncbi:uncharacterized protein MJAP1_002888 [Malassezia japonica]|uniref:Uncharacterized protein n=1 Tax=Malassezia japonica TaxID=223818 RepID=A0AAF0EZE0_9BASI|nr:uncharacterized protein MJAP1_002888 [Malassezia japonica]WFD39906.1 hypothetical protein MJAP1_002888 [Malassezia japonica]